MDNMGKILIVDDENMVTKTLSTLLMLEGFNHVKTFNCPKKALEFLSDNDFDLIISDFIMPDMNGIEFLSEAKKIERHCDTTQILLTGYADKENAIKAINEVGIFKYIEKPWNNENLIINIKNGIERTVLKRQLKEKILQLKIANDELEKYSKNLEDLVAKRTVELFESQEKLNAIFKNCADGILTFDKNHLVKSANTATCQLFGIDEEQILNKNFFEIIINEKNQKIKISQDDNEALFLRDFSIINYKNDKKIPVEISIATVRTKKEPFFVAVLRDVSYQMETQRLRDDFIATLTHDLRTPLLAGISGLEFIINGTLGEIGQKQKELLIAMKKSNEDMLGLTNALLEVYRYEAGKIYLCKTKFCINQLIKECAQELEPLMKKDNVTFEFDCDEELPINADKNEIKRVIVNLIGNAIKHGGENIKIEVATKQNDKDLEVVVKDNGKGLSLEDCEKLFKRFSQGTSKKRSCSTGLGLYLSRQIIEAHNGTIKVESELDCGSSFIFQLKNAITDLKVLL